MPNPPSSALPNAQSYDFSAPDTVIDRVTGLIWERRLGGSALLWREARQYCASLAIGGARPWRLPTLIEMTSLVDFSRSVPAIDQVAFPDTLQGNFWTATPVSTSEVEAWYVAFSTGFNYQGHRDFLRLGARCVRSGASADTTTGGRYADANPATIRDPLTGLTWQRAVSDATTLAWKDAVTYCQSLPLAGGGWRLPSMKELQTLVDVGRHDPAIDPTAFPGSPMEQFWTSSPLAGSSTDAWYVSFRLGAVNTIAQSSLGFARCVR
jgi:hypothetical protein